MLFPQRKSTLGRVIASIAALVSSASIALAATQPSVDGADFTGWTKVGQSDQLGIYAKGSTSEIYEIYTVVFEYDATNNAIPGTQAGFNSGDKILGIGVKRVSGVADYPILKFDPSNDSYLPATTIAAADGKTSFGTYGTVGDSVTHFPSNYGGQPSVITIKATPTNGEYPCGSYGCGNGLPGIRGLRGSAGVYQMFFDLTSLPAAYSGQLGAFDAELTIAINNGTNDSVVKVSTLLPPPPPNATLDGFYPPVDKPYVATNEAKAGQTIPFKFVAKKIDGAPILNLTTADLTVVPFSCGSATPTLDAIEEYATTTVTLQNFGNGAYQYNWKTPKSLANTCQMVSLDLPDPWIVDPIMAEFRFKK